MFLKNGTKSLGKTNEQISCCLIIKKKSSYLKEINSSYLKEISFN